MRLKLLAAALLIVVGIGAVGLVVFVPQGAGGTSDLITATATRTTVDANVVATGTLAARSTFGLSFGSAAQLVLSTGSSSSSSSAASSGAGGATYLVDTVKVKVGDTVKKGEVLATADTSDLQVQLEIAQANLAAAKARLVSDQGGPTADIRAAAAQAIQQAQLAYSGAVANASNGKDQNNLTLAQAEQAVTDAQANLATAQAGPTSSDLANAQDALTAAQNSLANAQQNLTFVQQQNQQAVASAQQALANAQTKLVNDQNPGSNAQGSPIPINQTQVQADQTAVNNAQAALDSANLAAQKSLAQAQQQVSTAQLGLDQAQRTYSTNTTPNADSIKAAQQALTTAQDNLAATKLKLGQSNTSSQQQIQQAQLSVQSAQTSYTTKTQPATADQIATDEAQVASMQSSLTTAQQNMARAKITSPIDGTVVTVNIQPDGTAPNGYAITVQSQQLDVTAEVAESDLPSLSVGQPATVTVSATGEQYPATVTSISPVASSSGNSSVVSYTVDVALNDTGSGNARSGMSADVAVTTQSAANVIAVPAIALQGSNGSYTVRVVDASGQVQTVPVQVGLTTSSLAAITSGLTEGESVVIGSRSARSGTTTTTGGFGGIGGGAIGGGALGGGGGQFRQGGGTRTGNGGGALP